MNRSLASKTKVVSKVVRAASKAAADNRSRASSQDKAVSRAENRSQDKAVSRAENRSPGKVASSSAKSFPSNRTSYPRLPTGDFLLAHNHRL